MDLSQDLKNKIEEFETFVKDPQLFDDRTNLFTQGFGLLSKLPSDSLLSSTLNDAAITLLYDTLPHPPDDFLGANNQFRQADGGNNNPDFKDLGRAGMPYARTCQGKHPLPAGSLPPTSLVFDELLKANGKRDKHPEGNSSLIFAFASLVTHSLFRTDLNDWNINKTSSYLDLSPLYGSNQTEQDAMRPKDGRGLLYPDAFSESRLGLLPPAAAALLVVWNRNHNYIAKNLLLINEKKKWEKSPPSDKTKRLRQDEEIFQTARLINCGSFISVIFGDYVASFLGLSRDGSSWSMQPFGPMKTLDGRQVGRGQGNHVSVEFNLLYRWHAVVSESDAEWTASLFKRLFGDKPFDQLNEKDLEEAKKKFRKAREVNTGKGATQEDKDIENDPRTRTFGGLQRGPDGRFADADVAKILYDATESPACKYGARGVPPVLKVIEQMGMEQARTWGVCTMNEFRVRMGLQPFSSFEEWNSDSQIAKAAERLYGTIDNLELYPGLHAEQTIPPGPGSGLCAGYTVTRAILSDAISLVRGDRFFTIDFTPANLTAWGMDDITRDYNNGGFGGYLPKLLMRTLPRSYAYNSVYSLFSFFTPEQTKKNLTKLKKETQYHFERPTQAPVPKVLDNFTAIKHVFDDTDKYKYLYARDNGYLTTDYGAPLVSNDKAGQLGDRALALRALFPTKESLDHHVEYYATATRQLIRSRSFKYDSRPQGYVNIVQDVINPVFVGWACQHMFGASFKSEDNPSGQYTEKELYKMLADIFTCVFHNDEAYQGWSVHYRAEIASNRLKEAVKANINWASWDILHSTPFKTFVEALKAGGKSVDQVVTLILGLAVGSTVNYAQATVQVIDFYLKDQYTKEREDIIKLCSKNDPASQQRLLGYYREAARLSPQLPALLRVCDKSDIIPQDGGRPSIAVNPGDVLFCSFKNAYIDSKRFPHPEIIDPTRPSKSYSIQGIETPGCPGLYFSEMSVVAVMKEIFSLPCLKRADGPAGQLQGFTTPVAGTETRMFVNEMGNTSVYPGSLSLQYDGYKEYKAPKEHASFLPGTILPHLFHGLLG